MLVLLYSDVWIFLPILFFLVPLSLMSLWPREFVTSTLTFYRVLRSFIKVSKKFRFVRTWYFIVNVRTFNFDLFPSEHKMCLYMYLQMSSSNIIGVWPLLSTYQYFCHHVGLVLYDETLFILPWWLCTSLELLRDRLIRLNFVWVRVINIWNTNVNIL